MLSAALKTAKTALLVIMLLLMGGCFNQASELFSLPEPSKQYLQLQEKIDEVLQTSAKYSAPLSGSYRQPVQLFDLTGDGKGEALAFFSTPDEKPLKIYIFENNRNGYETAAVIEGDGTAIASIDYVDFDGDGVSELVIGWLMGKGIKMISVYSIKDFVPSELITTDYSEYTTCDLDLNGKPELGVIRLGSAESAGAIELYFLNDAGEIGSCSAPISIGMESVTRIKKSLLPRQEGLGIPALMIEGVYGGSGVITDVFASANDRLVSNITLGETGESDKTIRNSLIYSRDIDADGSLDIPLIRELPPQPEGSDSFYLIEWYGIDSEGSMSLTSTTYHNFSEGWYLTIPGEWSETLTIRRVDSGSDERTVVFSVLKDEGFTDFLAIHTLTGDNRWDRAAEGNNFTLISHTATLFTAQILLPAESWADVPTEEYVRNNFFIIFPDWSTGLS